MVIESEEGEKDFVGDNMVIQVILGILEKSC